MNYKKIHDQLIERAKNRVLVGYKERHHIIPKCMGGTDISDNLVDLTAREHYIVHKLLCEIYPSVNKLWYAVWMMTNCKNAARSGKYTISSREYERYRLHYINIHASNMIGHKHTSDTKDKIRTTKIGHLVSDETRYKISTALKGKPGTWLGKTHTDTSKRKMSEKAKNRKHSEETRNKMSKQRKGMIHTLASRQKMSQAAKGKSKEKFVCIICGKIIGGKSNIIRHEGSH